MLKNLLSKSKHSEETGLPRKLVFRYRFRSNRDFQVRMLSSSDTNIRGTIRGLLNSVTSPEAHRVWYQVTYPSGQGVLDMSAIMDFVEAHTVLGIGVVVEMDIVVWDGPPIEKSRPQHRESRSGPGVKGEKRGINCAVQ
ncbi:hypothetical protein DOTSEDRAFT_26508 [Dothistroma septosporum NZE10]|uniref:Uncharacterized protein n=1 Tax=Dothistroma septosporum (strain NZE10 / CBS 128990) TaxID=675120 RepID=N1PJ29_DOTSN|nr:hypothetical protein DOTSEDRAFT_26508 [Dothistroma septosporum NZE10]